MQNQISHPLASWSSAYRLGEAYAEADLPLTSCPIPVEFSRDFAAFVAGHRDVTERKIAA